MRNIYVLFLLFLCACQQTKQKDPPKIYIANYKDAELTQVQFEPSGFQFDTLKAGDTLVGDFLIKNVGKNDLKIDTITKACSCTNLQFASKIIPIGRSMKVFFSIHPASKKEYYVTPLVFYFNTKPFYRQFIIEGYIR